jgi:hypothetical protein
LKGNAIKITETTFRELQWLCEEFYFSELSAKLLEFPSLTDLKQAKEAEDADELQRLRKKQINTIT